MDALDAELIRALARVDGLDVRVVPRCDSTNTRLLAEPGPGPLLLAAEIQTAGRGRRGRRWRSAPGAGATFSLLRHLRRPPAALAGLPLAIGVAAARALRSLGAADVALKWPNDLVATGRHGGAKLGGILVESRPAGEATAVVVGIGVNCASDPTLARRLRRPVAALDALLAPLPSRNAVIAALAREALAALDAFERAGLAPFVAEWRALDAYAGARLQVRLPGGRTVTGIARGIAASGALVLATARGERHLVSASLRQVRAP
ncbi:MAG: biotin--[acetyl-CoA-carboxylase] ligase [Burkholderiales bacterium]|nr:biotin--[acetyl-CoA-carboxylase] ligase [Burkholderiales bacterium]